MDENDIIDLDALGDGSGDDVLSIEELLLLNPDGSFRFGFDYLDLDATAAPNRPSGLNLNESGARGLASKDTYPTGSSTAVGQKTTVPDDTSSIDAALNAKIAVEAGLTARTPRSSETQVDGEDAAAAASAAAAGTDGDPVDAATAQGSGDRVDPLDDGTGDELAGGDAGDLLDDDGSTSSTAEEDTRPTIEVDTDSPAALADVPPGADTQTTEGSGDAVDGSDAVAPSVDPSPATTIETANIEGTETAPLVDRTIGEAGPATAPGSETTNLNLRRGTGENDAPGFYGTVSTEASAEAAGDQGPAWQSPPPDPTPGGGDTDSGATEPTFDFDDAVIADEEPSVPEAPVVDISLWSTSATIDEDGTLLITRSMLMDGATELIGSVEERWVSAEADVAAAAAQFGTLTTTAIDSLSGIGVQYRMSSVSEMLQELTDEGGLNTIGQSLSAAQDNLARAEAHLDALGEQPTPDSINFGNLSVDQGTLTDNGAGTWYFTPDANWNGDLNISYDASYGRYASPEILGVTVTAVNDAATVAATSATMNEDGTLTITQSMLLEGSADVDGDSLSAVNLSADQGTLTDNGDGTWSFAPDADFNGSLDFTYDVSDGTTTTENSLGVTVTAVNDAATVAATSATMNEDGTLTITQSMLLEGSADVDGDSLSAVNLSADQGTLTDNGDGTWSFAPDADFNGSLDFTCDVSDGTTTTENSLGVTVTAVNDAATVAATSATMNEDGTLTITQSMLLEGSADVDGDSLSAVNLSTDQGTLTDNGDGTWSFAPDADFNGSLDFTCDVSDGTTTTENSLGVTVTAVNDAATVAATSATMNEDGTLTITQSMLLEGSADVDGDSLSAVNLSTDQGTLTDNGDGTWSFAPDADWSGALTISYDVSDGTTTTANTMDVSVAAVADAPTLDVSAASGAEDTAIALSIASSVTDTDGSEAITSVVVAGVPAGASLSAGTDNGDGTWTLTAGQLNGLTVTPPADSSDDFTLTVTSTTTDTDPDTGATTTATTTDTVAVSVAAVADAPTLDVSSASAAEDTAIALSIASSVTDTDGSEAITSVVVAGVPAGASLSAGTDNGDGTWTLTAGQLNGLTVTPPADSEADFSLTVTTTTTDTDPDTGAETAATTTDTIAVSVAAVADAPTLSATDTLTGRGAAGITKCDFDISASLTDTDGSESLSITVAGLPDGVTLSAGTDNGDGTWTLGPDDLSGLILTAPSSVTTDFSLSIAATATDSGGDTATTTTSLDVALNHGVTLAGGSGDDSLTGGGLYDTITGGDGDDTLDGGDGMDYIGGGDGLDIMDGGAGNDFIEGQAGDDIAIGGAGDDVLEGGSGSDYLVGDVAPPTMYVMDATSDSILGLSYGGRISEVAVSKAEIMDATGQTDVNLQNRGITVDDDGNIFFTEAQSDSILMKPADGGDIQVIASENDIRGLTGKNDADPKAITIGSDGNIYATDDKSVSLLKIDTATGEVTVFVDEDTFEDLPGIGKVELKDGLVADGNGMIYVASTGGKDDPDAIFAIDTATGEATVLVVGTPFSDIDVFMTLAPNGDLIIADDGADTIFRVDTDTGDVSVFLSESDLEAITGGDVDLEGGVSFDAEGNFYIAEENTDDIYMWSGYDEETGEIDAASGELFAGEATLGDATTGTVDLEGGIAFAPDLTGTVSGNDTLRGGAGDDVLLGGGGDDYLDGGADSDVLKGGAGDDQLVFDSADTLIDGGTDFDLLIFDAAGEELDFSDFDDIVTNIEEIDISGSGDNAITIDYDNVKNITDSDNELTIVGDAGDIVNLEGEWEVAGQSESGGNSYTTYVQNDVTVVISDDITMG